MTNQEVFNKVVIHLRKQGCRSRDGGLCRYRDAWGHKCAAGIFIPDDVYDVDMENKPWGDIIARWPRLHMLDIDTNLIMLLQKVHDAFPVEEWETVLEMAREVHNLKPVEGESV